MADLIQEFFKRDLTEPELDELGELLKSDPESILRFEKGLAHYYLTSAGLSQPQLPSSLKSLSVAKMGLKPWWAGLGGWMVIGGLAFAGTMAVTVYHHFTSQTPATPLPTPTVTAPSPTPTATPRRGLALPSLEALKPKRVEPGAKGDELSITLTAPKDSLVTVRVLDSTGKELRVLFTGFVEPGTWAFKWDGLLSDGKTAPAGDYQIHVQSGAYEKTKNIRLKVNQPGLAPRP